MSAVFLENSKQRSHHRHHRNPMDVQIGPLRVIIIDTQGQYRKTVFLSICNALVQFLLGATNILVLGYFIKTNDLHALLCTVGWHFLCIEAISSLNYSNSWASPIRLRVRKYVHMILQICTLILSLSGFVIISTNKGFSKTLHGISGVIAMCMTIITALFGPGAFTNSTKSWKVAHVTMALPTITTSSVSLCLGIYKDSFQGWCGKEIAIVIIVFVGIYTLYTIYAASIKCCMRIRYNV